VDLPVTWTFVWQGPAAADAEQPEDDRVWIVHVGEWWARFEDGSTAIPVGQERHHPPERRDTTSRRASAGGLTLNHSG
jgi:hypothetical protein